MPQRQQTKTRKTSTYVLKCLLHFAQPGTRLLIVDDGAFLVNATSHDHWYINNAFDALRASEWITAPLAVGTHVAECFLTEAGRDMAATIESAKGGYTQLSLEELLEQVQATTQEEESNPMLINFDHVANHVADITPEQIGRCHLTYDPNNQPFFCVESESGGVDPDGYILQYAVRYSEERGFTCTCPAGHVGFAHVRHPSGTCKHVRWCVALILEERAALAELAKSDEPEGSPRPEWYDERNETSYYDGTRADLLLVGRKEADDATYARVVHANSKPSYWTEAEIKRDQQRYQAHPFNLLG
jgi:hypothetical protein